MLDAGFEPGRIFGKVEKGCPGCGQHPVRVLQSGDFVVVHLRNRMVPAKHLGILVDLLTYPDGYTCHLITDIKNRYATVKEVCQFACIAADLIFQTVKPVSGYRNIANGPVGTETEAIQNVQLLYEAVTEAGTRWKSASARQGSAARRSE